jgi:hypothetical protein
VVNASIIDPTYSDVPSITFEQLTIFNGGGYWV